MFRKILDSIRNLFASPEKRLEMKTRELAMQSTQGFDNLQKIIKDGEYAMTEHQRVVNDREQFLRENTETQVDQNVSRNEDNKLAYTLLLGAMVIGSILSLKGLKFILFGFFESKIHILLLLPVALVLEGLIVLGCIYINHFSERYRNEKGRHPFIYYQIKVAAYGIILLIPIMNLIEGFDSNYGKAMMTFNIFFCAIDFILHSSLISMSKIFTTARFSKVAMKLLKIKDKSLTAADQKLRAFNDTFTKAKTAFTSSAKQFVSSFKELQAMNATAATNTLYLLDNFTIWMLNNKVMQHALIPYHADQNGHPVVELRYFTPEQDSIRLGWDMLSIVRVDNTNNQQTETLNGQRQATELPAGNDARQQLEHTPFEDASAQEPESERPQSNPDDYDTMLDNVNPNDKIL